MTFSLRPGVVADVPAIFRVRLSVRENVLSVQELAALGITPDSIAALIAGTPENASDNTWVAEAAGEVIGFAMIDAEDACLFAAFLMPEAEGRGIGRALVARAEAALFAHHPEIWLETASGSRAEGFYRHLGWSCDEPAGAGDVRLVKRRKG